jgi:RNA polymerase sigma factor (sigma-70 family)
MNPDAGFEDFYRSHHPRLVATLLVTTGDLDVARDSVDEAFARALACWDRVATMASPAGWTYRVALNVARRRFRRRQLEMRIARRRVAPVDLPPAVDETQRLVADLPPRQRTAIVLRYVADLTEPEIARAMGIRRSTVSATLAAARARLAAALADEHLSGRRSGELGPDRTRPHEPDADRIHLPGGSHG